MTTIGKVRRLLTALALSAMTTSLTWAQDNPPGQSSGAPPAASSTAAQDPENPPLTGLDRPTSESPFGGRSYLIPGLQIGEAIDTNGYGATTSQTVTEISRALGSIDLQKLWRRYQVGLDYIAGGSYYTGPNPPNLPRGYQQHSLGADQRILWRTGQLSIQDNFSYLPEGSFGFGSYGGFGGFSTALGGSSLSGAGLSSGLGGGLAGGTIGGSGLYGGGTYGTFGIQPRIDNLTVFDVVQGLSPRSTVTLGAGYNFDEYLDKSRSSFPLINSQEATGQIGYNRLLTRKDQVAFVAAYQQFAFPGGGSGGLGGLHAYTFQGLYGHRITGRLDLVLGGGPQIVHFNTVFVKVGGKLVPFPATSTVTGTGSVSLGYTLSARSSLELSYEHYITPGSGFYAGANTDAARGTITHIVNRNWSVLSDVGYSYSTPLQTHLTTVGINTSSYQYWYAGGSLRRLLGRHFDAFVTYQYDAFSAGSCVSSTGVRAVCGQNPSHHVGMFGLDWHPRPIRLD